MMQDQEPGTRLQVNNATKRYGQREVLRNVNLTVAPGEIHGLVGPNGSGKSTLLKCVVGAEKLTNGQVIHDGRDVTGLSGQQRTRRGIGVKFQTAQLIPTLAVRHNIRLAVGFNRSFRSWLGSGKSFQEREDELLHAVRLDTEADIPASNLSHGKQQWLELAMALASKPDLLLLDEPTAGMSLIERADTEQLLRDVIEVGQSILIVDHDLDFVKRFCDRLTVLHNGEVVASGETEQVRSDVNVRKAYLGG